MIYLTRAANGQIPFTFIMKLLMLELPNLVGLLLPLGFYMSLLIAYGRLYAESEMTVLQACGYGRKQLLKHSFVMASFVAMVVLILMMWVAPSLAVKRVKLIRTSGVQTLIQTIGPGRFREIKTGKQVFYVEKMNRGSLLAENIFLARYAKKDGEKHWELLWAEKGFTQTDAKTSEDYLIFQKGKVYQGTPGHANYQSAEFNQYQTKLPAPNISFKHDIRTEPTASLWPLLNKNKIKASELQWRLAIPCMVMVLTFIAVPLSRVNHRVGKYAKLLPAIVIYIIYANFLFIARNWIVEGKVPVWIGMWWLHVVMMGLGGIFMVMEYKRR